MVSSRYSNSFSTPTEPEAIDERLTLQLQHIHWFISVESAAGIG
jgi:hypothetical protein